MTDHELCRAWRASTIELRRTASRQRLALAERRQQYLDEMERRNGAGFVENRADGYRARVNGYHVHHVGGRRDDARRTPVGALA